jgi:flagellar hook-length control protein FliK
MMSAKTVLTETPATNPTPAAASNAGNGSPGGAPSDFQNLLAGAVPPKVSPALVEPPMVETSPSPLGQLLDLAQQPASKLPRAVPVVTPAQAAPAAITRADLLKIQSSGATLSLDTADVAAALDSASTEAPADEVSEDEASVADAGVLTDWMDGMLPPSVFAPQAGSTQVAKTDEGGASRPPPSAVPIPASLVQQAGMPERNENMDSPALPSQGAGAVLTISRQAATATAAQNTATAFNAALISRSEATEGEKPATESWMNAMGDLTTRRTSDAGPLLEARLSVPVQDPRWADAIAHRLVMMARDGESVASLKLVPVDLGPLDIKISVKDGEANVHFGAAHQETRAMLEASMPRLRELLSAQGLQLANASVSHQSSGQNRPERSASPGSVNAIGEETEVTTAKLVSTSLLDIYA